MEEKAIKKNQDQKIAKKRVYSPPALTAYGKLTELTASGSKNGAEGSGMIGPAFMA